MELVDLDPCEKFGSEFWLRRHLAPLPNHGRPETNLFRPPTPTEPICRDALLDGRVGIGHSGRVERVTRPWPVSSSGVPFERLPLGREPGGWYGFNVVSYSLLGLCASMLVVTTAGAAHFNVLGIITAAFWLVVLVWAFVRVGSVAAYLSPDTEQVLLRHFWRDVELDASEVIGVEIDGRFRRVPIVILNRASGRVRTRLLSPDCLDRWLYQPERDTDGR